MKIFLSHCGEGKAFVNILAIDLKSRGFDVWYSEWELAVGDSLTTSIQRGIDSSSWLVVVLSPASVRSRWVREELNAALARQLASDRIYVLPILLQDCELPTFLRDRVYADFRGNYIDGLRKLLWTLTSRYHPEAMPNADEETRFVGDLELKMRRAFEISHNVFPANLRIFENSKVNLVNDEKAMVSSVAGEWRGLTDRLRLSIIGNQVAGSYDWLGFQYSGMLKGTVQNDAILFSWAWDMSGAQGEGIFYRRTQDSLIGGWWYRYEEIDTSVLIIDNALPPRHWEFHRLTSSSFPELRGTEGRSSFSTRSRSPQRSSSFPFKGSERNAPCRCGSGRKSKNCCGR